MLRDNLYYTDPFLCLADFGVLHRVPEKVDAAFRRKSALGEDGHPEHGPDGKVLQRPRDSRICARHLEIWIPLADLKGDAANSAPPLLG